MDMFEFVRSLIQKHQTHDAEEMLAEMGVQVFSFPMRGIRGLYKWFEGWPTVFIDSDLKGQQRQFVLAHEMAHFLFHKGQNRVFMARQTQFVMSRYERQADLFAACFLHPFPSQYFHNGTTITEISRILGFEKTTAELYCNEFKKHKIEAKT